MNWPDGIFFDMNAEFSDEEGREAISSFGEQGMALYRKHFWTDLIFVTLQTLGITALFWFATSKFDWSKGIFRVLIKQKTCSKPNCVELVRADVAPPWGIVLHERGHVLAVTLTATQIVIGPTQVDSFPLFAAHDPSP